MKFNKKDRDKTIEYVSRSIVKRYHVTQLESIRMINKSRLNYKIEHTPLFVAHSSPDQLADMVVKENRELMEL